MNMNPNEIMRHILLGPDYTEPSFEETLDIMYECQKDREIEEMIRRKEKQNERQENEV
jgi:hypothetical protein